MKDNILITKEVLKAMGENKLDLVKGAVSILVLLLIRASLFTLGVVAVLYLVGVLPK